VTVLDPLVPLATEIIETCTRLGLTVVTAESCTGGLIAALLTEVPGSSLVIERGLVTYSNAAKTDLLAVPLATIERDGAVSESVARAMAEGALARSTADLAVAVTGIAGPGGGTAEKPVGLVHFGALRRGRETRHARHIFPDLGRSAIRLAAAREALIMLREITRI
jgi:nicotinamide-nucleotide amidase